MSNLRAFVAVAETGSLTRAADRMYLSQPAVSGQIKGLEQELGLSLFRRTGRGVVLTEAGERLLEEARAALLRADGMSQLASRLRGQAVGTLRLGIIDCGFGLTLSRIIRRMATACPDVEVSVASENSGANLQRLLEQRLDLVLYEGELNDERVHGWRLATCRLGVIGPAAWETELRGAGWATLAERPWIFQSAQCSYHDTLKKITADRHVAPRPRFHADGLKTIAQLVAEGLALSLFDLDQSAPLVDSGAIFVWPGVEVRIPVWLAALESRREEPAIATFAKIATDVHPTERGPAQLRVTHHLDSVVV